MICLTPEAYDASFDPLFPEVQYAASLDRQYGPGSYLAYMNYCDELEAEGNFNYPGDPQLFFNG